MSGSEATPADGNLVESLKQLGEEYKVYRVAYIILMVHAGKISVDTACNFLGYQRDEFAALCKQFNVVVPEEEKVVVTPREEQSEGAGAPKG